MRGRRRRHRDGGKDDPEARRNEGKGREEPGEKGEHLLSILRPRLRVRAGRHRRVTDAAKVTRYPWRPRAAVPAIWRKLVKLARLEGVQPHDLRHGFASRQRLGLSF